MERLRYSSAWVFPKRLVIGDYSKIYCDMLKSYNVVVCGVDVVNNIIVLDPYYYDYSVTTMQHIHKFIDDYGNEAMKNFSVPKVRRFINQGFIDFKIDGVRYIIVDNLTAECNQ